MKKKILIVAIILLALVSALLAYTAINAGTLVRRYKPDLERAAGQALKSRVTFGDLDVKLIPSPSIRVSEFKISKRSAKEGVTFKDLRLHLRFLPLLSGKVDVSELELVDPSLTFLKDSTGIRIDGLTAETSATAHHEKAAPVKSAEAQASARGIDINLESLAVKNGTLILKDLESGKTYTLSKLNTDAAVAVSKDKILISKLHLDGILPSDTALGFQAVNLTYLPPGGEAEIREASLTLADSLIRLSGNYQTKTKSGSFAAKSDAIDLKGLYPLLSDFSPEALKYQPQAVLRPDLQIKLAPGAAPEISGAVNISSLALTLPGIAISGGSGNLKLQPSQGVQNVSIADLAFKLNNAPLKAELDLNQTGPKLDLKKLLVSAFSGTLKAAALVNLEGEKSFSTEADLAGINLEQALIALKPGKPAKIAGTLTNAHITASGQQGPNMLRSLQGKASLLVKDGRLKDLNLAAKVLKGVHSIPFISGALYEAAPESERKSLEANETTFKSISGSFTISDANLHTQDLAVESALFSLRAQGRIGFNASLDMGAQIAFNKAFSASLASKVKEIKQILNKDGELVIPLKLSGTAPEISVVPDITKLLEGKTGEIVKEKAFDLLDKALGGKKSDSGTSDKSGLKKLFGL